MKGHKKTRQPNYQGSSDFGLEFIPNNQKDDRKLTRTFYALRLHQAAKEAAAQAGHDRRSSEGDSDERI
jgi:hypothetical protein